MISAKELGRLVGAAAPTGRQEIGALSTSFNSDGTRLASFAGDGSARVWSTAPLGETGSFPVATGFITTDSLSMGGGRGTLLVYPDDTKGGTVVVFDPATGETIVEIPDVVGQTARLSPDGTRLAAQFGTRDEVYGPVQIHDLGSGTSLAMEGMCHWTPDTEGDPQLPCVPIPEVPFQDWVRDLAFSPDGSLLALNGAVTGSVTIWESSTGEMLLNTGRLMPETEFDPQFDGPTIAFAPGGERLVVSTRDELWVYDTANWQRIERFPMERMTRFKFSPDGAHLVAATPSTEVAVIDTATWTIIRSLSGHNGHIHDVAISPDSVVIASSDVSGVVRLWDLESGKPLQAMTLGDQSVQNVAFLDSNHVLVTPQTGPNALILTIDVEELLEIARNRVTRDFTTEECQIYLRLDACPSD